MTPEEEKTFSELKFSETLLSDQWKFRKRALEIIRISNDPLPNEILDFLLENFELFITDLNPGSFYEFLCLLHEK